MYIDMNILASAYFFGPPPLFDVYKIPVYHRIGNDDDHKLKKSCFRSIKTGYLRALWHGRRMKANAAHIFIYVHCTYVYLCRLKENLFDELLKSDWFNQKPYSICIASAKVPIECGIEEQTLHICVCVKAL